MRFLNPWGLLGLLTVPIIIGLHLYLERNRRYVVSSMFLWDFLDNKLQGVKPKYLRFTWLLLLDLLIASVFSLALARPEVNLPNFWANSSHLIVLLDNSSSMLALDESPDRLSSAKEDILDLIDSYVEVTIITIGGVPEIMGDTRAIDQFELAQAVEHQAGGGIGVDLRTGIAKAISVAREDIPVEVHIFTDGAFELPDLQNYSIDLFWHFYGSDLGNQALLNPSIKTTGDNSVELFVQIANYSKNSTSREVIVTVDGNEIKRTPVDLQAETITPYIIPIIGSGQEINIHLSGYDLFPEDDAAYLGVANEKKVRIALISDEPYPLNRAFMSVPQVDFSVLSPDDYPNGKEYDLIVFRNYLPEMWPSGTVLVFDVPEKSELLPVTGYSLISQSLFVAPNEIIAPDDLTGIRWGSLIKLQYNDIQYQQVEINGNSYSVLVNEADNPVILQGDIGSSDVILFLPVLSEGTFTSNPAFPVFISKIVEYAKGYKPNTDYFLGGRLYLPSDPDQTSQLTYPNDDEEQLSSGQSFYRLNQAGRYTLRLIDTWGGEKSFEFTVNVGDLAESNVTPREWCEIVVSVSESIRPSVQVVKVDLSSWLLCFGVMLLLTEAWRAWR